MRLLADVNVSRHVVARLRKEGYDIVRVPEILDPRISDEDIIAEAHRRGAVVLSHDQDFTAILATTGATQPSLINIRGSEVEVESLASRIAQILRIAEQDLAAGAIVTLDDRGVRIHRLPVGRY